jgi:hypothetical protein
MLQPAKWNFTIYKGCTFNPLITWKLNDAPVDLTGCRVRMQIKANRSPSSPVLITLDSDDDEITLGDAAGTIVPLIEPADTADLPGTTGVYDMLFIDTDGIIERFLEGDLYFSNAVTTVTL